MSEKTYKYCDRCSKLFELHFQYDPTPILFYAKDRFKGKHGAMWDADLCDDCITDLRAANIAFMDAYHSQLPDELDDLENQVA